MEDLFAHPQLYATWARPQYMHSVHAGLGRSSGLNMDTPLVPGGEFSSSVNGQASINGPLMMYRSEVPFHGYPKSAALLSNSQTIVRPLDAVLARAHEMFSARAYLHQYSQHGILREDFVDAFVNMEQVLANYASLR